MGRQWAQSKPSEYQQNQREGGKLESHLQEIFKEKDKINPKKLAITLNTKNANQRIYQGVYFWEKQGHYL